MDWNDVGDLSMDDSADNFSESDCSNTDSKESPSSFNRKSDLKQISTQVHAELVAAQRSSWKESPVSSSNSRLPEEAKAKHDSTRGEFTKEPESPEPVACKPRSRRSHPNPLHVASRDHTPVAGSRRGSSATVRRRRECHVDISTASNLIPKSSGIARQASERSGRNPQMVSEGLGGDRSETQTPPSSTKDLYARIEKLRNANKNMRAKLQEFSKLLDSKLDHAQTMRIKAHAPRIENSLEDSTVLRQELNNAQKQVSIYQCENARLIRSLDRSNSIEYLNELSDRIIDLTQQNKQLKNELSALSTINRRTEKSQQQLEKDTSCYPKQIRSLLTEVRTFREKARVATAKQRELEQSSLRDRSKIVSLQEKFRALLKDHDANVSGTASKVMEAHVSDMESQLEQMKQKLSGQNTKAFKQRAHFRRQLQKRDQKIEELVCRVEELVSAPRGVSVALAKKTRSKRGHYKSTKQSSNVQKDQRSPPDDQVQECKSRLDQLSESIVSRGTISAASANSPEPNCQNPRTRSKPTPSCSAVALTASADIQQEIADAQHANGNDDSKDIVVNTMLLAEMDSNDAYSSDGCTYSDEFESN